MLLKKNKNKLILELKSLICIYNNYYIYEYKTADV